jgi:hypothetical protein
MQEVSGMVIPTRFITQELFIQNTALALLHKVSNPYASDPKLASLRVSEEFLPERLIELFRKATCMSADQGDVPWLRIWIFQRDILLDSHMQDIFLLVGRRLGVVSDMLARNGMFDDLKNARRHPEAL